MSWRDLRDRLAFWRGGDRGSLVVGAFVAACLAVPTAMQTKLAWYLNPFYPVFALLVGWLMASALRAPSASRRRWCAAAFVAMALVAEARIGFYSLRYRDIDRHQQGLLLREAPALRGHLVHAAAWAPGDQFVLEAIVGARAVTSDDDVLLSSGDNDYLVASRETERDDLHPIGCRGAVCLFGAVPTLAEAALPARPVPVPQKSRVE
jgi:4-amino-4-deoxy-L-arabinose transferase-like glycosyltransferase